MPKVFGWAKKLAGHSSKSTKQVPTTVGDSDSENTSSSASQSPEKKAKLLEDSSSENCSSSYSNVSSENIHSNEKRPVPTKRPSFIRRLSPEKRYSTDSSRLSPEKGLSPEKKGGLEKRHNSDRRASPEKRPSGLAQRFASFRIGKHDRSSKSKSKSPEPGVSVSSEVCEKNHENEFHKETSPEICQEDSSSHTVKENVIPVVPCDIDSVPNKEVITVTDRISNLNQENCSIKQPELHSDLPTIRSHDHNSNDPLIVERNINPRTSRIPGRQSISEKLYGEVIKEFDKIRTTRPKVTKDEVEVTSTKDSSKFTINEAEVSSTANVPKSEDDKRAETSDNIEKVSKNCDDKIANSRFTVRAVCEIVDENSDSSENDKRDTVLAEENTKDQSCISEQPPRNSLPMNENDTEVLKMVDASPTNNSNPVPSDCYNTVPLSSTDIPFIEEVTPEPLKNEQSSDISTKTINDSIVSEEDKTELKLGTPHVWTAPNNALSENSHEVTEDVISSSGSQENVSSAIEESAPSSTVLLCDESVCPIEDMKEAYLSSSSDIQDINPSIIEPSNVGSELLNDRQTPSVSEDSASTTPLEEKKSLSEHNGNSKSITPPEKENNQSEDNGDNESTRILDKELSMAKGNESPKLLEEEKSLNDILHEIQKFTEDSKDSDDNTVIDKDSPQNGMPDTDTLSCKIKSKDEGVSCTDDEVNYQDPQLDMDEMNSREKSSSPPTNNLMDVEMDSELTFKDEILALLDKTFPGNNEDRSVEIDSEVIVKNESNELQPSKATNAETEGKMHSSEDAKSGKSDVEVTSQDMRNHPYNESISDYGSDIRLDSNKEAIQNGYLSTIPGRKTSMPASLPGAYSNNRPTDGNSSFEESYEEPHTGQQRASLPSSPLAPRRKKKSHPVPAVRTFYTVGCRSDNDSSTDVTTNGRDKRSYSFNTPPARPPAPSVSYDRPPVRERSSTTPSNSSEISNCKSAQSKHVCSSNGHDKPAAKVVSADRRSTSSYRKSLNPFDSDDDDGEELEISKEELRVDMKTYKSSKDPLNPFDSDDDEVEDTVNTTVEDRKCELPPTGYNPFDDDDDEEEQKRETSKVISEDSSTNPFGDPGEEEEEEEEESMGMQRGSPSRQTLTITPESSPFRRESTRASLPTSGRVILSSKKKRQAPLPPGYGGSGTLSACNTPLLPSRTALFRGDSYSSLDRSSLRKGSTTSCSTLSLSSPKRTPPPRPPPPKTRAISLAQLK